MTLREYVQSLAQRLNKIEGTSGVSKDYVDAADDIIRGSVTALRRHVDIEDETIRGSIVTLGETVDEIIDGTQPVASAMEADKAIASSSGLNLDAELKTTRATINYVDGVRIIYGGIFKCGPLLVFNGLITTDNAKTSGDTIINSITYGDTPLQCFGGYVALNALDASFQVYDDTHVVTRLNLNAGTSYNFHGVIAIKEAT